MALLSAKEVAREFGVDARTFRKFMREILPREEQPGQGNRYNIEQKELKKLRKKFDEWHKPKTQVSSNGTKPKAKTEVIGDVDEDLTLEGEPTDEELSEIELDIEELEI